jgi:gamma-glutamyl phosphate reductase
MAAALEANRAAIQEANAADMEAARPASPTPCSTA